MPDPQNRCGTFYDGWLTEKLQILEFSECNAFEAIQQCSQHSSRFVEAESGYIIEDLKVWNGGGRAAFLQANNRDLQWKCTQ